MRKFLVTFAAALLVAVPTHAQENVAAGEDPATVEIMIVGSYHFANPGADVINMESPDMLAEDRQRELHILAEALAQWAPDRIALEDEALAPGYELPAFANAEQMLGETHSESVQIGFRLAMMLDHEAVYGFDEQPGEGEPDYFPFVPMMEFAQANGQAHIIESAIARTQAKISEQQALLAERSVAESLLFHNDPALVEGMHDATYYAMLPVGNGDEQPGAELNAYWYMRNAKMFAKLAAIAQPGDRVLVVVGSGHARWLRHFAQNAPGFALVEAQPYVRAAAIASAIAAR
ncbi:DUF5694 domain-containing protein [Erythrobacter alti]|uniref:DUF5694 domain-containing protein n=1 Tax=Erythrobacter alti TaxID=1896145 RepID=UPI0030F4340F